jgi:hypothetical protein
MGDEIDQEPIWAFAIGAHRTETGVILSIAGGDDGDVGKLSEAAIDEAASDRLRRWLGEFLSQIMAEVQGAKGTGD